MHPDEQYGDPLNIEMFGDPNKVHEPIVVDLIRFGLGRHERHRLGGYVLHVRLFLLLF